LVLPLIATTALSSAAWGQKGGTQPDTGGACSGAATVITFSAPAASQVFAAGTTSVTATGTIAAETNLTTGVYVDNVFKGDIASGSFSYIATGLGPGAHQIVLEASRPGAPACTGYYSNQAGRAFSITASTPSVAVSAPASNVYPASVPLTVSISDPYPISSVSWYVDGTLVNTTTTAPYSYSWAGGANGSHTFYAKATDTYSEVGTSSTQGFSIVEGAPPSVNLSVSPTSTTAPGTISLSATTSGGAYPISNVQFFCNSTPATGPITSPPYSNSWSPVGASSCTVTAVATDSQGQHGTSSGTVVTVSPAAAPTVSVTASTNCTTLPATITMNAAVTSAYPVTSLNFVVNGVSYPQTAGTTGSYQLPVPTTGGWGTATNYAVSATAANQWSSTGTSNTVNISEAAHPVPTITLNSVETTDDVPAEIAVGTTPVDTVCGNNYIASVQLRLNGTLQATATTAPYNFLINGAAPNTTYAATVQATNQGGQTSGFSAPQSVTTPASDPTVTGDSKSQTRTTEYEYDPTFGKLNKTMVEPESSDLCLVTTVAYDPVYGIPTSTTTRNCNSSLDPKEAAVPTDYSVITSRTSQVTYDSTHTFPNTKTNALNQTSSTTYDPRFGTVLSQTDVNGLAKTVSLDAFGRITNITTPDGNIKTIQYQYCSGISGGTATCPPYGAYVTTSNFYASNGSTQIAPTRASYYDSMGRSLQVQQQGFSGTLVNTTKSYDSLGRISSSSQPYYTGASPPVTSFAYDVLNRTVKTTDPLGAVTNYSYNGQEITKSDGYGRNFVETLNSVGETVSVVDPAAQVSTYQFDPFGNLVQTVDPQGVTRSMVYDLRGRKTSMNDPDMGNWAYYYDSLGQFVKQTDAKSQSSTMAYDALGRMTQRTEPDLTSYWEYDSARAECAISTAKAASKLDRAWTNNNYSRIECFDNFSRSVKEITTIGSKTFTAGIAYDSSGRPSVATYPAGYAYPSGFSTSTVYNSVGYPYEITNTSTGAVIWQETSQDALGDVTAESMSAGAFTTTRVFDQRRRPLSEQTGTNNSIQNDTFAFDAVNGNLVARGWQDANGSYSETFGYDQLNRLTSVSGPSNKTYSYDASGNFTQKSDVGTYTFTPGTHRLASITGSANGVINPTFNYDPNGNLTSEDGASIVWSSFNMASSVTRGSSADTFIYGPDHARVQEVSTTSSGATTIDYISPLFEVWINSSNGTTENHNYINSSSRAVAMLIDNSSSGVSWRYFHEDLLGSVEVVTDQTGNLVERLSYDPFGRRRNTNGTDLPTIPIALDSRGFTGQEQMDNVGLVNMNGRIYDPTIARFVSADPVVQAAFDLQTHNRYSYVSNRPFIATDPTGFDETVPENDDSGDNDEGGEIELPRVTVIGNIPPPDPPEDDPDPASGPGPTGPTGPGTGGPTVPNSPPTPKVPSEPATPPAACKAPAARAGGSFGGLVPSSPNEGVGYAIQSTVSSLYSTAYQYITFGASVEISTVNTFTSGGGGVYGLNTQYTYATGFVPYGYYTPSGSAIGSNAGLSATVNLGLGSGAFTGLFSNAVLSGSIFTGGSYWSAPDDNGDYYMGLVGGFAFGQPGGSYYQSNTVYQQDLVNSIFGPPPPSLQSTPASPSTSSSQPSTKPNANPSTASGNSCK
jgi:RHS repeat-associated protein